MGKGVARAAAAGGGERKHRRIATGRPLHRVRVSVIKRTPCCCYAREVESVGESQANFFGAGGGGAAGIAANWHEVGANSARVPRKAWFGRTKLLPQKRQKLGDDIPANLVAKMVQGSAAP